MNFYVPVSHIPIIGVYDPSVFENLASIIETHAIPQCNASTGLALYTTRVLDMGKMQYVLVTYI